MVIEMDDKELADTAHELLGEPMDIYPHHVSDYVHDWQVAGAILSEAEGTMDAEDFYHALLPLFHEALISNPRAIIEACIEAMTND